MVEEITEIPYLRNIGAIVTYKCQVACSHCILAAGPDRTEQILPEDVSDWVGQIADYRGGHIKVLSLTGGEPFYDIDTLKKIVMSASSQGLMTTVVTNAFWAKTPKEAVRLLKGFPLINMLAFSTDVYHLQSIPFDRIVNAISAAEKCDIPYNVAVCTEDEDNETYKDILGRLKEITEESNINTAITFPVGRGAKTVDIARYRMSIRPPLAACSSGNSPMIFPDGRVLACIGPVIDIPHSHPLVLGNLREEPLSEILDASEMNPILHTIRLWGPHKLISLIESAGYRDLLPKRYIKDSVCNACYALMSNQKLIPILNSLTGDSEYIRMVIHARSFYLNEDIVLRSACKKSRRVNGSRYGVAIPK